DLHSGVCMRASLYQFTKYGRNAVVTVILAPVRERPAPASAVIAELPCGALVPETRLSTGAGGLVPAPSPLGGWLEVSILKVRGERIGFISGDHVGALVDLPDVHSHAHDIIRHTRAI